MICYLVRHGKDDDTVRGGWSNAPLTSVGVEQVKRLASKIVINSTMKVGKIYTSDLLRARQTADILSAAINIPVIEMPVFRETNNGLLAGMDNRIAEQRYPGLYWGTLEWEQHYPDGESPSEFYSRISNGWKAFKESAGKLDENVILVTHGGVINVIQCIENGIVYSNKANPYPLGNAEMVGIEI